MRSIICLLTFTVTASFLHAQEPNSNRSAPAPSSAIELKRVPPTVDPKSIPPLLQQYDFAAQIQTLEQPEGFVAPPGSPPQFSASKTAASTGVVPKDYHPNNDVPLTPTAAEAVQVSERWRAGKNPPMSGPDGRVMYSFGGSANSAAIHPQLADN